MPHTPAASPSPRIDAETPRPAPTGAPVPRKPPLRWIIGGGAAIVVLAGLLYYVLRLGTGAAQPAMASDAGSSGVSAKEGDLHIRPGP